MARGVSQRDVVEIAVNDPRVAEAVAQTAQGFLFSDKLRERMAMAVLGSMKRRSETVNKLDTLEDSVLAELVDEWRITSGGPNGMPTSTSELIEILRYIDKARKGVEDVALRAAATSVAERKSDMPLTLINIQNDRLREKKEEENINSVSSLQYTPEQREMLRQFANRLRSGSPADVAKALLDKGAITQEEFDYYLAQHGAGSKRSLENVVTVEATAKVKDEEAERDETLEAIFGDD
jgi:hypothetical protein